MKKSLILSALLFCGLTQVNAQTNPTVVTQFTTSNQVVDGYYITSKISGRILTKSADDAQIYQSALLSSGTVAQLQNGEIAMNFTGNVTNPAGFAAGTYATYKLQWGNLSNIGLCNRFFDVEDTYSGARVVTWIGLIQDNQRFIFVPTGDADGSFYIRPLHTGKYLQIAGGSGVNNASGAFLEQRDFGGGDNQKFYFHRKASMTPRSGEVVNGSIESSDAVKSVDFSIYPNPADDKLVIAADDAALSTVSVIDANGREVNVASATVANGFELEVSSLNKGTYFVVVTDSQGNVSTEKFVKK